MQDDCSHGHPDGTGHPCIDCLDERIAALEASVDSWKAENVKINFRADDYQQGLIDALTALEKHVCVKAGAGDGMNKVDYYPIDEDDCELCRTFNRLKNKVVLKSSESR